MGSTTIKVEDDRPDEIESGTIIRLEQPTFNDDTIPEPVATEADSVEEARAQIEQTRAEMSETIDALKVKLAPENLKAEAKETAKAAAQGLVEGVVETTKETVSHVVEATKEKVEHLTEVASVTATHIGTAVKEAVGTTKENLKQATSSSGSMAKGAASMISDAVKNNPLPAAIVGGTLIYLFLNAKKNGSTISTAGENTWTSYAETHPNVEHQSALTEMRDKVGDVAGNVREKVGDMAGTVREKVSDAASTVGEKVNDTVSAVKYKVSNVASDVGNQAQHQAARAKTVMEENPLMVGAAVLALGAAVGLMLPITEQEHRLMGQTRDRLVDQANEKAGALAQQAGVVAQKTLEAINENARDVLTSTKESARNAFDTVKSTANDAVQELKDNNTNLSSQNQPVGQFTI